MTVKFQFFVYCKRVSRSLPLVKGQTVAYEQEASGAFIGSMETAVFQEGYIRIKTMKIFVSIKDVGYRRRAHPGDPLDKVADIWSRFRRKEG